MWLLPYTALAPNHSDQNISVGISSVMKVHSNFNSLAK